MLVVVRDVEKESEIESLGSLKKAIFFRKRVLQVNCNCKMSRKSWFAVVCSTIAVIIFSGFQLFFPVVGGFWIEFAVDRFVATRGKLRVSEVSLQ